ncbi:MAG: MFS transporter [Promethearchaeota archaeon]|jgi:Na+/melibiose symporter-like transporter
MSESTQKFDLKQTAFIGLAFFTTGIAWSMFNTQVNITLFEYLGSYALVGAWMAMDNLIGVFIQPFMGTLSDNTRTKFGRRMPYLIVGIPIAAIFFVMISTINSSQDPLWLLLLWMFFFNVSMASYRSQAVALMPDFVRPVNRSKGNAVINFMGGVGALLAYIFNLILVPISLFIAFLAVAIIMVLSLVVLLFTVKEKESYSYQLILNEEEKEGKRVSDSKEKPNLIESFRDIISEEDKATLIMLLAIFAWFVGYQALEALFTVYGMDVLGLERGDAGFMLSYVAIAFLLAALPAGILGSRIGRRSTIKVGLVLFISALIIGYAIQTVTVTTIILFIAGVGWAFININSIVIVWEMAPTSEKIGTYTGVYYFFSFLAAILGPFMVGSLTDALGNVTLFLVCSFFFIAALILMFLVKRGEVKLTDEDRVAKEKAIQDL